MSQAFVAEQGEQVTEAYFARPAFGLFKDLPGLLSQLFRSLQGYGLALSGLEFHHSDPHLGEEHLRCTLSGSVIRIFLDRVEISSTLGQGSVGHDRRTLTLLEALQSHLPEITFSTYVSLLKLHGALPETRLELVLSGLSAVAPKSPGPLLFPGAVFYYGADGERLSSALTLDPSTLVEEGLFLQARVIYDAARLEMGGLSQAAQRYLRDVLRELDLVLEGFK